MNGNAPQAMKCQTSRDQSLHQVCHILFATSAAFVGVVTLFYWAHHAFVAATPIMPEFPGEETLMQMGRAINTYAILMITSYLLVAQQANAAIRFWLAAAAMTWILMLVQFYWPTVLIFATGMGLNKVESRWLLLRASLFSLATTVTVVAASWGLLKSQQSRQGRNWVCVAAFIWLLCAILLPATFLQMDKHALQLRRVLLTVFFISTCNLGKGLMRFVLPWAISRWAIIAGGAAIVACAASSGPFIQRIP